MRPAEARRPQRSLLGEALLQRTRLQKVVDGRRQIGELDLDGTVIVEEDEPHAVDRLTSGGLNGGGVGRPLETVAGDLRRNGRIVVNLIGLPVDDDEAVGTAIQQIDVALDEVIADRGGNPQLSPELTRRRFGGETTGVRRLPRMKPSFLPEPLSAAATWIK